MKKIVLSALLAAAMVAATRPQALAQMSCPTAPAAVVIPPGVLTGTVNWTSNNIYQITGNVVVGPGAVLNIQPGTIIKGDKTSRATLIVARGGRLEANGTATQPIVFTSNEPAGSRRRGDWGGIIILGRSQENIPGDPSIEGVTGYNYGPGFVSGTSGPENPAILNDNSGTLRYVRIEFPGVLISTGNEINGLTLGAVGSGTTIDHVQVSYCGDDSFEWFGGTVNAKHLISYAALDDDFDVDNGFAGKVQYGLALRDPSAADVSDSNGFESDNNSTGSNATPQTAPVFSNMTMLLPSAGAGQTFAERHRRGAHLRRNSATSIFNSVFAGPYAPLLHLDAQATNGVFITPNSETQATNGNLVLRNNVLATGGSRSAAPVATPGYFLVTSGSTFNLPGYFNDPSRDNLTTTVAALNLNADNFGLVDIASAGNCNFSANCMPDFSLPAASPLVSGASFADAKLGGGFFDNVAYRGAFGPAGTPNWAAGWSNFNPQNFCYNVPGRTALAASRPKSDQLQGVSVVPNPSAGAANLSFELKRGSTATVRVLDVTGREVATVVANKTFGAGPQLLALPADLKAGVYVASITTSETSQSVRFVVAR